MAPRKNGKFPILTPKELKQEPDVGIVTPAMQKVLDAARAFERERNGNEFRFMQLEREFCKTGVWPAPPPGFPEGCRRCKLGIFNGKPVKPGTLCKYCKAHPQAKEFKKK
ncbi:hypothetical protein CsatB_026499 [Cannabis sativa]